MSEAKAGSGAAAASKVEGTQSTDHGHRDPKTTVWVNSTYFAEGFPYMIVKYMLGVFLTDINVRELYLGFLNFMGLPWNLKFLWAPFVDFYGTKRRWLLTIECTSVAVLLGVTVMSFWASSGDFTKSSTVVSVQLIVFLVSALAFIAATHDISIDAYYLAALPDRADQARYTGDRVLSYRVAVIYVRSLLVAAAAVVGWVWSWAFAAATMLLILAFHAWYLPQPEKIPARPVDQRPGVLAHFWKAFRTYLDQPRVFTMLAFVTTYKIGDEIMFSMRTAFLMRGLGVSKVQLSWLAGILGTSGSILGSMISAWWIAKVGLKRAIWPLTLMMNLNIWAYIALAYWRPDPAGSSGIAWIAAIHAYEEWAAGMGNAVLIAYLMRTCKPEFKAGHYAVGSALMSLGFTFVGGFGGYIVEKIGYTGLFLLAFFASIPGMLLIFRIPYLDEPQRADGKG